MNMTGFIKKAFVGIGFLGLLSLSINADEIEDKMNQLRQLERQIDQIQTKTKQLESKKQKTQSDISQTLKSKTITDLKVAQLRKSEIIAQDSLISVQRQLKTNEELLHDLKQLSSNEFLRLYYIEMQDKYIARETNDKYLLSMLLTSTVKKIREMTEYHKQLVQTQEQRRREFVKVHSSRIQETKKSQQFQKKYESLVTQEKKLDTEKQALDTQFAKLKKDASELESLITKLMAQTGKKPSSYQFTGKKIPWPVKGKIIRSFGEEFKSKTTSILNNGIDIAVAEGTNVLAVDDGEVIFAERYGGQGKLMILDHKNGFYSVYAYNSELLFGKGSQVKKGTAIAKSGKTGSATQPSLHFELRKDGRAVDPLNYLE